MYFDLSLLLRFPCSTSFSASFICFSFPVFLISFSFIFLIFTFLLTVLWSCSPCLSTSTSIFLPTYLISHFPICPVLWQFLLLEKCFLWTRHYELFLFLFFFWWVTFSARLSLNISNLRIGKQKHKETWFTASKTCIFKVKFI